MSGSENSEAISNLRRVGSDFHTALLGIAGHDLRQPLQVIQNTYDLLRVGASGARQQILLDHGQEAVSRLNEELDRVLNAIRLFEQTKSVEISSIALEPLFWRLVNENEDAALKRGIDLRAHPTQVSVRSNAVLLSSILRNLLTNAIKYTEPGGRILIGCRKAGREVRIDVYDTGIGIAAGQLSRIFEAFERIDTSRGHGLGLGLFVVRRALDVLGHRIEIKSTVSRGSRFSVFAPL